MIPVPDHLIAAPAPRRAATPDDEAAALAAFAGRFAPRLRRLVQAQLARRGDAARQALPRTREAAAALHRDIGAGLDGAVRKRLFDRLAGGQMGIETARLERHAAAEDRAARRTASNSFLAQQMAEVLDPAAESGAFRRALANGRHEIAAFGAQTGQPPDAIAARQDRFASDLTLARTLMLAHRDPEAARTFYLRHRARLLPAARPGLEHSLERADEDRLIDRVAGRIVAAPAGDDRPLADWEQAAERQAAALRPGDEAFRRRLHREVAGRAALLRATLDDKARRRRNTLLAAARGAGGPPPTALAELTADPGLHYLWVKAPEAVRDAVERLIARNRTGHPRDTGHAGRALRHFLLGLHHLNPAGFRALDLGHPAFDLLAPADHLEALAAQTEGRPPPRTDLSLPQLLHAARATVSPAHLTAGAAT